MGIGLLILGQYLKSKSDNADNQKKLCGKETIVIVDSMNIIGLVILVMTIILSYLLYKQLYKQKSPSFSF